MSYQLGLRERRERTVKAGLSIHKCLLNPSYNPDTNGPIKLCYKGICLESRYPRYTCSSDFTFPLAVGAYGSLQLSIQPWICALGTHYGWVDRGSVEYEVCPILLHMASTGNRTPDLLILSPTPYPLGHVLPSHTLLHGSHCNKMPPYTRQHFAVLFQFPDDSSYVGAARNTLPPRQYVCNRAVRCVVLSMARFMAAYFTHGHALFVYPPHCPRKLPPLHTEYTISEYCIFLSFADLLPPNLSLHRKTFWVIRVYVKPCIHALSLKNL